MATTAQQRFDAAYISSTDICEELQISRSSLMHARKAGKLPDPIVVSGLNIFLWEREAIRPFVDAWKLLRRREAK